MGTGRRLMRWLQIGTMAANDYLNSRWEDARAAGMDALDRLVYRSNLLGQDWRITNTGGGNTSSKTTETDPLTGQPVSVLWVKGSGGDLRTAGRANFSSLYMDKLHSLQGVYARMEPRGLKTPAEDRMVGLYAHCTFNLNTRAPSIDTPLHALCPLPARGPYTSGRVHSVGNSQRWPGANERGVWGPGSVDGLAAAGL